MNTKGYPLSAILKQINWIVHKDLHKFLTDNGITPFQTIEANQKVWRIYDQAAYNKACALRRQRDQERGFAQQSSTPPEAKPDPALHEIRADVRSLHEKIDLLLKELGAVQKFDEVTA